MGVRLGGLGDQAMSVGPKRIAVLGGDRRMAEAVRAFLEAGPTVCAVGIDCDMKHERLENCRSLALAVIDADAVVLPVQGLTDESLLTVAMLNRMRSGAILFAGIGSDYLRTISSEADLQLNEYREADEFAVWNSIPSAEGAIQMAMELSPFVLFKAQSLVIRFGRTGKALALLLKGLHSQVTVVVRDEVDLARVWAAGYHPVLIQNLREAIRSADLIFNTAPAMVLSDAILTRAQPDAVLIDLASAPGGTDFAAARELGITARLAPGLPGIVAPVTAGRIIADVVLRHLNPVRREEEP